MRSFALRRQQSLRPTAHMSRYFSIYGASFFAWLAVRIRHSDRSSCRKATEKLSVAANSHGVTRHISETVQNTTSIEDEQEDLSLCAVSNVNIEDDLKRLTTHDQPSIFANVVSRFLFFGMDELGLSCAHFKLDVYRPNRTEYIQ